VVATNSDNDPTGGKIRDKLVEIDTELPRLRDKRERLDRNIGDLEALRASLITTLTAIGEEIPDAPLTEPRLRRRGGSPRAIDVALVVTEPGEELSKYEVAKRVAARGLTLESSNPANALATAMSRDVRFENLGRGRFRRKAGAKEAPPNARSNGASDEHQAVQ
jgi:hypothetical protein